MSLTHRISEELKQAMHARDAEKLDVLRAVRNEIIKLTKTGATQAVSDDDVLKIVKSQIKQRREAISQFEKGNRQDLIDKEKAQIAILEAFLPDQIPVDDLRTMIATAVQACDAKSVKDMGRVMKEVMLSIRQTGKDADNRIVSELVKTHLLNLE